MTKKRILCIFLKDDRCNSQYNKGLKCDGINPPKKCPYLQKKYQCPKCKGLCIERKINNSLVYDCQDCKDQISESAIIRIE